MYAWPPLGMSPVWGTLPFKSCFYFKRTDPLLQPALAKCVVVRNAVCSASSDNISWSVDGIENPKLSTFSWIIQLHVLCASWLGTSGNSSSVQAFCNAQPRRSVGWQNLHDMIDCLACWLFHTHIWHLLLIMLTIMLSWVPLKLNTSCRLKHCATKILSNYKTAPSCLLSLLHDSNA